MSKEKTIKFTTRLNREDVSGILEAFSEGLKEGVLKVQKSGDTLELEVPQFLDLEINATHKNTVASFEIVASWRPDKAEVNDYPEEGNHEKFSITSSVSDDNSKEQDILQSAEELLKQTAATASTVAKVASRKASNLFSKASETEFAKTYTQKTSELVAMATKNTRDILEKLKDKTKGTFLEIKEDAEHMHTQRKQNAMQEEAGTLKEKTLEAPQIKKEKSPVATASLASKAASSSKKMVSKAPSTPKAKAKKKSPSAKKSSSSVSEGKQQKTKK